MILASSAAGMWSNNDSSAARAAPETPLGHVESQCFGSGT